MEVFAKIIGYIGTGVLFLSYQMPKKKQIVLLQILSISIFTVHFFLLGSYTGAIMNLIALTKTVLYYFENKPWFRNTLFTAVYAIIIFVAGIVTWQGFPSLFPLIAMLVHTFAYNIKQEKWFRLCMFPTSPLWMVYAILTGSIPALIGEILTTTSLLSAIIRYDVLHKEPKPGGLFSLFRKPEEEKGSEPAETGTDSESQS